MIFKKLFILALLNILVFNSAFAQSKKDVFVIDGRKYTANPKASDNTSLIGTDQAIIQISSDSDDVSSAIIFDLSAGEDFSAFKKGTKINILNEVSEIPDEIDEDFVFPDEAVLIFSHNFLDNNEAVGYSNDENSSVVGTMTVKSFNKRTVLANFSFKFTVTNALVIRTDSDLNQTNSRLTADVVVTGQFKTFLE